MNQKLFNYIFIQKSIAQIGQPIELLTEFDGIISGRFLKSYTNIKNEIATAELIELELEPLRKNIFKYNEILIVKLTFQNEFINNQCSYSLICMYDYFEGNAKAEVKLKNKKILTGFITYYPYPPGNYDPDIGFIELNGKICTIAGSDIETFSLLFEHSSYFDSSL